MADPGTTTATMAENEKSATAAAHEPALQNGAEGAVKDATLQETKKATEVQASGGAKDELETDTGSKSEVVANENGQSDAVKAAGESPDRKRKHSPLAERDWRDRRDEGHRGRGSDRGRGQGRGSHNDRQGGGRGRGRPFKNYRDNVRTNYEAQAESSDPDEIRKQVEFYFSDSNLFTDRFLLGQIDGSKNKPVPVKTIHNFKRMRHFQPYSAVVASLRESTVLDIIGAEGDEQIQRKLPLPETVTDDAEANVTVFEDVTRPRSIYAKGFGAETATSQFDIEAFFTPYGPINAVRLRRTFPDKIFKGSVFVEFDSEETAQQFLELDPKPKWNDKELKIISKEAYVTEKAEEIKAGKIAPKQSYHNNGRRGGHERGRGGRGGNSGRGRGRGRDGDRKRYGSHSRSTSSTSDPSYNHSFGYRNRSGSRSRSPSRTLEGASGTDNKVEFKGTAEVDAATTQASPTETDKKRSREETDVDGAETIQEHKKTKTTDAVDDA